MWVLMIPMNNLDKQPEPSQLTCEDMEAVFASTEAPVEVDVAKKIGGLSEALRVEVEGVLGYNVEGRFLTPDEVDKLFDYDENLAFNAVGEKIKANRPTPKKLGDLLLRLMKEQND